MQPGDTIKPGSQPVNNSSEETKPSESVNETAAQPGWTFSQEEPTPGVHADYGQMPEVTWTASEYIAHDKGVGWFMGLAAVTGLAAAVVYLLTRDVLTVVIVLIVAVIFGVFALRKPQVLSYRIDHSGITIAEKHYPYTSFRSFAIQEEGVIAFILLIPLKRFMPGLSVYFPPEQEDQIVDTLGAYLPHEDRTPDVIDHLMRKVRF